MSERRKTVFITGASRGIGHATAAYFVRHGWRAITCSRDEVPPECPRDERHEHISVDLELTRELPGTIERLHNILGGQKLHALVNNAGYSPKAEGGRRLGCLDSDMAVWQQTYAINFFAPVYFSRACAPLLAETEPVQRDVAVKIIKSGTDTKSVLARFEAERQALALMDHPNIAKVLDGGLHDGRPFFHYFARSWIVDENGEIVKIEENTPPLAEQVLSSGAGVNALASSSCSSPCTGTATQRACFC